MRKRFLYAVIVAVLMLSMSVNALAATAVSQNVADIFTDKINIRDAVRDTTKDTTRDEELKGLLQNTIDAFNSDPFIPKLNMKLSEAFGEYLKLKDKYDSAKNESDRQLAANEISEIKSAVYEVVPNLIFGNETNIQQKDESAFFIFEDVIEYIHSEGMDLALDKNDLLINIGGGLVKPKPELSDSRVTAFNKRLIYLKDRYPNLDVDYKGDVYRLMEQFKSDITGYKNNEKLIATIDEFFSSLEVQNPNEEQSYEFSFSDVPPTHWAYKEIMAMASKGLLSGTSAPVDGVGKFSPHNDMTKAEVISVIMRVLYPEELNAMPAVSPWWYNAYSLALEKGILKVSDPNYDKMDFYMDRKDIALVLARAAEKLGQSPTRLASALKIPDYLSINAYYRDSIVKAYSMGLIGETDIAGTYYPTLWMNRAQFARVLNRLVDSTARLEVDYRVNLQPAIGIIVIREGMGRSSRPAQEGDKFVKEDGTTIVLQKDKYGIVGGGQGIAPDIGLYYNGTICEDQAVFTYETSTVKHLDGAVNEINNRPYVGNNTVKFTDSLGNDINNRTYRINRTTGSGHWDTEWQYLKTKITPPSYKGTKDGEVSPDEYSMYRWDNKIGKWTDNF